MQNAEFERLGLDYVYVPWEVHPEQLKTAVEGLFALNVAGFNVTIPHKQQVMAFLDEVTEEARMIGAVNTVVIRDGRSIGYNTDFRGWVEDIQQDIGLSGKSVFVIGAGGAARAICVAACLSGASRIVACDVTREIAAAMTDVLRHYFPNVSIEPACVSDSECRDRLQECQIVVNVTPVGMTSQPGTPIPVEWLTGGQYVYDAIYNPAETELLRAARERGCKTRNGLGMLATQGALAFEIWTGKAPDARRMEQTLGRLFTA